MSDGRQAGWGCQTGGGSDTCPLGGGAHIASRRNLLLRNEVPHRPLIHPRGTLLDVDSTERSQCKSGSLQTPSWAVLQDRFAGHDRQLA